jgi:hypothetical protein
MANGCGPPMSYSLPAYGVVIQTPSVLHEVLQSIPWIARAYLWVREQFASNGMPGITSAVHLDYRLPQARFKCKILVHITNQRPGPVRIAAAYFVFEKGSPLKPDPLWSGEHRTGRFLTSFFCPKTGMHDWSDVYLRPGENTNVWIGIDPEHPEEHIKQARAKENIGRVYFHLTCWTESNRAKTRWVYRKL